MSIATSVEKRALSKDEFELVEKSHYPDLESLDGKSLGDLASRLRTARDKARDLARQQRREQRGKADPKGTKAAKGNEGQTFRKQIFANALQRVNSRMARLQRLEKRSSHIEAAHRALAAKRAAGNTNRPAPTQTAGKGMKKVTSDKRTVKPTPSEKGRVSQAVKKAQAKKDSR